MSDFAFTSYLMCFRWNSVSSGEVSVIAIRKRNVLALSSYHWSERTDP